MVSNATYDVIIVGGGLAGLSLAILLADRQYRVLVIEKETYPKHKVCGEYISMESWPFLQSLGVPLADMELPIISKLQVTDHNGYAVNEPLPAGGFGISRYKLDAMLADIAQHSGATILTATKADDMHYANDTFTVSAGGNLYTAPVVCGAWGKRSNLDIKLKRPFVQEKQKALDNYVGIKYHISYPWPGDTIGLHNFPGGYCGISPIEEGKTCLCYLTNAATLRQCSNDIPALERTVLMQHPVLSEVFSKADFLYHAPLAISQISFSRKEQVLDHVLLLGDTAGMITPLCGNGMSMAMHAAKLSAPLIDQYLQGTITREVMEQRYTGAWSEQFSRRLSIGRMVQRNFGRDTATTLFLRAANYLPFMRKALVIGAAGKVF